MDQDATIRLIAERELHTTKTVELVAGGCAIIFDLTTIPYSLKRVIRKQYDLDFPVPPVVIHTTPAGNFARFDVENKDYQEKLTEWQCTQSYGVLAGTLGMSVDEVKDLESHLPCNLMEELFSTSELINGVQSEPLADLIKESIWSPEVMAWIENYTPPPGNNDIKISDKPLFRQIDAMLTAGLDFERWEAMTPRERMLIMSWYDYKNVKEGYVSWWYREKDKGSKDRFINPMRATLPR